MRLGEYASPKIKNLFPDLELRFRYTGNTEVFTENIYELYFQECKND